MIKLKKIVPLTMMVLITLCIVLIPIETAMAASKVKINKTTAVVTEGDYLYLSIKGTTKKATWTSNNKYKATVSKNGKVTTNSTGKVTITAKIGKSKYTCKVAIIPNIDPNYKTDRDIEKASAEINYLDKLNSGKDFIIVDGQDKNKIDKDKNKTDKSKTDKSKTDKIDKDKTDKNNSSSSDNESEENWISSDELRTYYKLSPSWFGHEILLVDRETNKIVLTDAPASKFEKDVIYECKYDDYTIKCYYSFIGYQIIFNLDDLKDAGIIN